MTRLMMLVLFAIGAGACWHATQIGERGAAIVFGVLALLCLLDVVTPQRRSRPRPYTSADYARMSCGGRHDYEFGNQVSSTMVRWSCGCGAYRDVYDPPPRHG